MIVEQLQRQTVRDNGGLTDRDVREGTGVNQHGLMLDGVAHGGVDGVAHPRGHRAGNLEVLAGHGLAGTGVRYNDLADALAQILQIARDGQNCHQLGTNRDAELGLHQEAVQTSAEADDDVAQGLCAEVDNPAHLDALGVDVQTLQALLRQPLVVVVALMLHTRIEGDHGKVVGVHDVVNIAGQTQGELGHRHQQRVAAASRSALDVHGRSAGGLTQRAAGILADVAQTFDQAQRNGGFALAEGSGRDRGNFDEFAVRLVLQAIHDLNKVELRGLAIGDDFVGQQTQLLTEVLNGRQVLLGLFRNLPILVDGRIKHV